MAAKHKLPFSNITIMGIKYDVVLVKELKDNDGNECWGDTDSENYIIKLVDGPRKRVNRVLCHELVHVWQDAQGDPISEERAEKMEVVLFDLFTNSPEVVAFLQKTSW